MSLWTTFLAHPVVYMVPLIRPRESVLTKRHVDRFSRFCTAHPCAQRTQIDIKTTERATSVAISRIRSMSRCMQGDLTLQQNMELMCRKF